MPKKSAPPASESNGEQKQEEENEEEKEEQEPPRVPSLTFISQEQAILLAHRNLLGGIADLRAALGVASESEEEQLDSNRALSSEMVRQRQTISRERNLQDALAVLRAMHQTRRLARARLLSWQDNDSRLAHRQETELRQGVSQKKGNYRKM